MTVPPAQPDDPTPATPAPFLPTARERLTDAGLRTASKGAAALGRITDRVGDRVRRKLDERAAGQDRPSAPQDVAALPAPTTPQPVAPQAMTPQPVAPQVLPAPQWAAPAAPHPVPTAQAWAVPAPAPARHSRIVPVAPVQPTEIIAPAQPGAPATHWGPVSHPVPAQRPAPAQQGVPQRRGFNPAAAAAIVVAVLFPPAGLGMAKSARRECRETGQRGANLALLAHVIAAAGTSLLVLCFLAVTSAFAFGMVQLGNGVAGIGHFFDLLSRLF